MSYHSFNESDIIRNFIKAYPESNFHMFQTSNSKIRLIYNNQKNPVINDEHAATYNIDGNDEYYPPNVSHVPYGFLELYGQNIARPFNNTLSEPDFIYPFITKDSGLASMASVSTTQFNSDFTYGDTIKGLGTRGATISSQVVNKGVHIASNSLAQTDDGDKRKRDALRTTFNHYARLSPKFIYEKGLENLDSSSSSWEQEDFRLIQIPSIFYGESIKKGSVKLDWYTNGELVGTLEDVRQNGELIVSYSKNAAEVGKFVGLVFYGEGFIILTNRSEIHSSSDPRSDTYPVVNNQGVVVPGEPVTWYDFMEGLEEYTLENIQMGLDNDAGYPNWAIAQTMAFLDTAPYTVLSVDSNEMSVLLQPNDSGEAMALTIPIEFSGVALLPGSSDVSPLQPYYDIDLVATTTNKYLIKLYSITYALIGPNQMTASRSEVADPSSLVLNTTLDENGDVVVPPPADQITAKDKILEIIQDNLNLSSFSMQNVKYSFNLYFKGEHTIPTMLMMANIEKSDGSHSNNPTFIDSDRQYTKLETAYVFSTTEREHILLRPENPAPGEVQTLKFKLKNEHNLGDAGAYFPLKIQRVYDNNGVDVFKGLKLVCKTLEEDKNHLEIYRVLQTGIYEPLTTNNQITIKTYNQNTSQVVESQSLGYQITDSTSLEIQQSSYERNQPFSGRYGYFENPGFKIKNTVKSKYRDPYAEYEDHTYISKIGIYDEDRNLIAIAKLATPVKKTPDRDFTFKLKLDL